MALAANDLRERAAAIELLVLDVDGVLTDGSLYYGPSGEALKRFNVKDGHAIVLAREAGVRTAILTARSSSIVEARARELGIAPVAQGARDKRVGLGALLSEVGLDAARVAYMGDDVNDLGPLSMVRLAAAPADACAEARAAAHYVAKASGGRGAVREFLELILMAKGSWNAIVEHSRTGR